MVIRKGVEVDHFNILNDILLQSFDISASTSPHDLPSPESSNADLSHNNLNILLEKIITNLYQIYHNATVPCRSNQARNQNQAYVKLEYEALKALYISTNGSNWSIDSTPLNPGLTWKVDTSNSSVYNDPCAEKWFGISCSYVGNTCSVTEIYLFGLNLNGFIPKEIGYLTTLQVLVIGHNSLEGGPIPTEIGRLQQLSFLLLEGNGIPGMIPTEIGLLTFLRVLFLAYNKLSGRIPTEIAQLSQLDTLVLKNNYLSGSIPQEVQNLAKLKVLSLQKYLFSGDISMIGSLTELRWLELYTNMLSGQITSQITSFLDLHIIVLDDNIFTGPIPSSLGSMEKLNYFSAAMNQLNGTIPPYLGNINSTLNFGPIQGLLYFDVSNNYLTGTIPSYIGNAQWLFVLSLQGNYLTGNIPSELGNANMYMLDLRDNMLSGHIPYQLFNNNSAPGPFVGAVGLILTFLDLSSNLLSGPIPETIGDLHFLLCLDFYGNKLSGNIPTQVGNIYSLEVFAAFDNMLSGPIPCQLGNLVSLTSLSIGFNSLTGPIPEEICNITSLSVLELSNNKLDGAPPTCIGTLINLNYIYLAQNSLNGPLMNQIDNLQSLRSLFVGYNKLSGKLPYLLNLTQLERADFSNNMFIGSVNNIINMSSPIEYIGFSNNRFTGRLEYSLFSSPYLKSFSAAVNCFDKHSFLPQNVCSLPSLQYLNLDGMSNSEFCKGSERYTLKHVTRPLESVKCLLSLPSLQTLHLSGNKITGSLEAGLTLGANLIEIDLSHNLLRNNIPDNIFRHPWRTLNLGYNKLNGGLSTDIYVVPNANITLQNNRLSGSVSLSYCNSSFASVSILEGNIFDCTCTPASDSNSGNCECGSQSTNRVFVAFAAIFATSILIIFMCLRLCVNDESNSGDAANTNCQSTSNQRNKITANSESESSTKERRSWSPLTLSIDYLLKNKHIIYFCIPYLFITSLGILLSWLLHKFGFGTHSFEYIWEYSFAFLSGEVCGIIVMVFLALFIIVIYFGWSTDSWKTLIWSCEWTSCKLSSSSMDTPPDTSSVSDPKSTKYKNRVTLERPTLLFVKSIFLVCLLFVTYVFIPLVVNFSFVICFKQWKIIPAFLLQSALSLYKILFMLILKPHIINEWARKLVPDEKEITSLKDCFAERCEFAIKYMPAWDTFVSYLYFFLNVIAIVIIPIIATLLADSNCFSYYMPYQGFGPAPVSSNSKSIYMESETFSSNLPLFHILGIQPQSFVSGVVDLSVNTNYEPSFSYSYQCVSSLMTSYVPVFIYFSTVGGILYPWFRILIRWLQVYCNDKNCLHKIRIFLIEGIDMHNLLSHASVSAILKLKIEKLQRKLEKEKKENTGSEMSSTSHALSCCYKLLQNLKNNCKSPEVSDLDKADVDAYIELKIKGKFEKSQEYTTDQIRVMLVLAVTFGLVDPLLGIAIILSILMHISILQVEIAYFIRHIVPEYKYKVITKLKNVIETRSNNIYPGNVSRRNIEAFLLTLSASMFMWWLVFDTMGDAIDPYTTLRISSVVFTLPFCCLIFQLVVYPIFRTPPSFCMHSQGFCSSFTCNSHGHSNDGNIPLVTASHL